jgi:hypothetical protein
LTNLFLHHFPDDALSRVLSGSAGATRAFVACEPRRSAATLIASRLVFAMGANDVTRHDAVVSVRAGFRDQEISGLFPNSPEQWDFYEAFAPPFTHCFAARRINGSREVSRD